MHYLDSKRPIGAERTGHAIAKRLRTDDQRAQAPPPQAEQDRSRRLAHGALEYGNGEPQHDRLPEESNREPVDEHRQHDAEAECTDDARYQAAHLGPAGHPRCVAATSGMIAKHRRRRAKEEAMIPAQKPDRPSALRPDK